MLIQVWGFPSAVGREREQSGAASLQTILLAWPSASNREGRGCGAGQVGLESWSWLTVQMDLLSSAA